MKPFQEEAMFWNAVWTSAGKPIDNSLHLIMKKARNLYHYAIRKCKKAAEKIKKDKLLNSCNTGKNNIFDELRRMRQVKKNPPTSIDGKTDPAKRFSEVYSKLYSSIDDAEEIEKIELAGVMGKKTRIKTSAPQVKTNTEHYGEHYTTFNNI